MERIIVGNIEIELTFKNIKNIHLSVHPPIGNVTVSAPLHVDKDIVRVFLIGKLGWIRNERTKFLNQPREAKKLFITRESHHFFGKRYLLNSVENSLSTKVILKHNKIDLVTPPNSSIEYKQKVFYNWYRRELRKVLGEMISHWESRMNVKSESFGIRKMKTKWGSCNSTDGKIWFNIELAKKPTECIEYIVVHELVHLLERNHNKRFVLLMNQYLPDWKERKKQLNELPL
jgi:predicted metal-dependent hydrolase